jgi:hypothetical protein
VAPLIPADAVTAWQFAPVVSGTLALAAAAYLAGVRLTGPAGSSCERGLTKLAHD